MSEELRNIFEGWAKEKYKYLNPDVPKGVHNDSVTAFLNGLRDNDRQTYVNACIDFVDVCLKFGRHCAIEKIWEINEAEFQNFLTNVYQS